MKIRYYGHSCFTVGSAGYTIALDPYDSTVPGYKPLEIFADQVICSHGHGDHNYEPAVEINEYPVENPFSINSYETFHDNSSGLLRGKNKVTILHAEGLKVVHMGDTGCIPNEMQQMTLAGTDLMMIPVGGHYTVDAKMAKEIIDIVKPRIVVPMHYRNGMLGYSVIAELSEFTKLFDNVNYFDGETFELTKDTPAGVYVLKNI